MKLLLPFIALLALGVPAQATPSLRQPPIMCDYVFLELEDAALRKFITHAQAAAIYDNCMAAYGYSVELDEDQCNCINHGVYGYDR